MKRTRLGDGEIREALRGLPGWRVEGDRLRREFQFPSFVAAFGFMTRVALASEKMDHHPDWSNVYRTVTINLHTHDAGGITALDIALAQKIDELV